MAESILEQSVRLATERLTVIGDRLAELEDVVASARAEAFTLKAERMELEKLAGLSKPRKVRGAGAAPAAVAAAVSPQGVVPPSTAG